jgi:SOS-response transcriptional repressor LexA
MSLGGIIRQRREELGLTQDQVATQVPISKPYLSNIETGKAKNPPTDRILRWLERALRFEDGQLIKLAHLLRTPADVRQEHELLEAEVQKLRAVLRQFLVKAGEAPQRPGGGVDLDLLARQVGIQPSTGVLSAERMIPIINRISAGYPQQFTDLDYPPSVAEEYVRCMDVHDSQAFGARVVGDSMEPLYHEGDIVVFSPNTPLHVGDDCFVRFAEEGGTTFKRFYQDDESTIRLQPLNSRYRAEAYPREQITGLWPAVLRIQRLKAPLNDRARVGARKPPT